MTSPKSECERLMNAILPFAEEMLKKHGEFFPYGGAINPAGAIVGVATDAGRENPTSDEVIATTKKCFIAGARRGEYRATALVYDCRVPIPGTGKKSDAIAVALDHKDGFSVTVFFPYVIEKKGVVIGELFASAGDDDIFPRD